MTMYIFIELLYIISRYYGYAAPSAKNTYITSLPPPQTYLYNGTCDVECDPQGSCWGPGPRDCEACRHVLDTLSGTCVEACDNNSQYIYMNECHQCDDKCLGCKRKSNYGQICFNCKKYKRYWGDETFDCVSKCSEKEYVSEKAVCERCHDKCQGFGCFGPGRDDCNPCAKPAISYLPKRFHARKKFLLDGCLLPNEFCPNSYFEDRIPLWIHEHLGFHRISGSLVCIQCHPYCSKCTSYGFSNDVCQECLQEYENCSCPIGFYFQAVFTDEGSCTPCSRGCIECVDEYTCVRCNQSFFRVYEQGLPSPNALFLCMDECPSHQRFSYYDETYQKYCSALDNSSSFLFENSIIVYSTGLPCIIIGLFLLVFFIKTSKTIKRYKSQVKNKLTDESVEILEPAENGSAAATKLEIVKETDVKKTEILGKGAFGTVYKGTISRQGNKGHVLVAVKVLNPQYKVTSTKNLLQEAGVMAGIDHPSLLRLLAVCVTSNVMLITPLMPLGDLRNYLHNRNKAIDPKTMLSWCVQISQGMAYLEGRRLVHRDLATRNVLIQSINRIKLSDFGLARALGLDKDLYSSRGGKLPVKWMPLESLKTGVFTHKSDVWSFGVTVWEILTYGEEPYNGTTTVRGLSEHLEGGTRLHQPEICSADIYKVLMSCWAQEPQERPSFVELAQKFSDMGENPGHFIILPENHEIDPVPELASNDFYLELTSGYVNLD